MKYHLDTIPLWDALHQDSECLLCALRRRSERQLVDRALGAAVMSPDTRIKANELGFCNRHQQMFYAKQNKLGQALMLHTHLKEVSAKLDKALQALEGGKGGRGVSLFSKLRAVEASGDNAVGQLIERCLLCEDLDKQMGNYLYTLLHLYQNDSQFKTAFLAGRGLCLKDLALLIDMAPSALKASALTGFYRDMRELMKKNLSRLEEEIEWFTLKFDYRNADKPWNNSRDSVERGVNKLRGWALGDEPFSEDIARGS